MSIDSAGELDLACHVSALVAGADPDELVPLLGELRLLGYRRGVLPPLDPAATDAAALRRAFVEAGLSPVAMAGQSPGANVASADDAESRAGSDALRAAVDFACAIGADQLGGVPYGLFGPPGAPTSRDDLARAARAVGRAADYAADRGVMMTFEVLNRYETSAVNTAAQAVEFADLSESDNLLIHLDTFHMAIEEADIAAAIRLALPRIGYLELGQSGRGLLSTGVIDIADVISRALDDGYTGRWGIEAFSRPLVGEAADMLAIWRTPYTDPLALASDAIEVVRKGWAQSAPGRRAQRLSRASR
ncbi:sugar phosphate isomerase/epimerase family protein [Microbacterium sp.]|uniref:sugar phosphate isomerase/epimerase family protein n=1 Tax=Microbacterium sp. TaxID=51671 RepID=UPI003A90349E